MIIGTGIDLIELERVQQLVGDRKFVERILTKAEQSAFESLTSDQRKTEYLAGRFTAKEAYAKAFGTGIGSRLSWLDIEILNDESGKPVLKELRPTEHGVHLSITHTRSTAGAVVILESL